jgi:calcium-dependent protein kinase
MDINNDGKIDYAEFQTAVMRLNVNKQKTYLQTTFKLFDANNDGSISLDELRACFGSQKGLSEILAEADVDKDGVISFEEFFEIMMKSFN